MESREHDGAVVMTNESSQGATCHRVSQVRGGCGDVVQLLEELLVEVRALSEEPKQTTAALQMLQAVAEAT